MGPHVDTKIVFPVGKKTVKKVVKMEKIEKIEKMEKMEKNVVSLNSNSVNVVSLNSSSVNSKAENNEVFHRSHSTSHATTSTNSGIFDNNVLPQPNDNEVRDEERVSLMSTETRKSNTR